MENIEQIKKDLESNAMKAKEQEKIRNSRYKLFSLLMVIIAIISLWYYQETIRNTNSIKSNVDNMKVELDNLYNEKTQAEKTLDFVEFIEKKNVSLFNYVKHYPNQEKILEKNNELFTLIKNDFDFINRVKENELESALNRLEKLYSKYWLTREELSEYWTDLKKNPNEWIQNLRDMFIVNEEDVEKYDINNNIQILINYLNIQSGEGKKMDFDQKYVLENIYESLIPSDFNKNKKDLDIDIVSFGRVSLVDEKIWLYKVPISMNVNFEKNEDFLWFLNRIEKWSIYKHPMLYKINSMNYDVINILRNKQEWDTLSSNISMYWYFYK